jgi:hypothetical protein
MTQVDQGSRTVRVPRVEVAATAAPNQQSVRSTAFEVRPPMTAEQVCSIAALASLVAQIGYQNRRTA